MLTSLRRAATVIVAGALTLGTGLGAALADISPSKPAQTGPDTMYWTGMGAPVQQMCGSSADSGGAGFVNGSSPNSYELWIFGMDAGSITGTPTLTINGQNYGGAIQNGGEWHIVTPYIDPNTIVQASAQNPNPAGGAFTSYVISNTGTGNWSLKISHGCAGPNQAQPLSISKTGAVSYNTDYTWSIKKTTSTPEIDVNPSGQATASYQVVVTNTGSSNNHIAVDGTIHVTNPNNVAVSLAGSGNGITDTLSDGITCNANSPPALQPGDNPVSYHCDLPDGTSTSDIGNLTNTATVTWGTQTLSDGSQLAGNNADYTLTSIPPAQGQPTTTDQCVTPSDPQAPAGTFTQVCASDGSKTFTYQVTYPITNAMVGTCTPFTNTATLNDANSDSSQANVKVCVGADLTVKKDATPSFTRTYNWTVAKSSDQDGNGNLVTPAGTPVTVNYTVTPSSTYADSGWLVTGKIHVTNPNDWESVNLTDLADSIDNGASCIVDGSPGLTIPEQATVDYSYKCDYQGTAPSKSDFTNTATAKWDASAASTDGSSAQGQATGNFDTPTTTVDQCVSVSDTLGGTLGTRCAGDGQGPFTYPVTFNTAGNPDTPGQCTQHPNTATLTTKDTGTTTTASDSVTVCVAEDLGVVKGASPAFTRTYNWSISKQANPVSLVDGGTVNYTVQVNQVNPPTDSGWTVTGTITVSNPNLFESVTHVVVADNLSSGDAPCVVANSGPFTLAAGAQQTLNYTCTYAHAPSGSSDTNNGIATWDAIDAHTPTSMSLGQAPFTWGAPTKTVNQTIHVTDSQGGALGTVTATDPPAAPASKTFTYSKTFGAPAAGCPVIVNTATITETGQQAKGNVTNCTLGALTMGFWHNQNGQAIINGDSVNGTALYTYLHGFAPFSDLTGTSASAVAAYFTKVFNAANAAGTGAPMLKAQMLATALNVYFSQNGNNKIGAPAPIGGVLVNISQWSAAFGGATHMTVSQMLSYASGQWNGGTPYSSKTLTSTAINAFTAVNQSSITS